MFSFELYPVTMIIIVVTVIVSMLSFNSPELRMRLMMNPYQVFHRKEYARVFTHGLIHADWLHLIFNMYVLYGFGQQLEMVLTNEDFYYMVFGADRFWGVSMGRIIYITLYIGGIVFATLPSMIKNRDNPGYNSLGASGAVSAVLFVYILIFPFTKLSLLFLPIPIPAIVMGVLFLAYEYWMNKRGGTRVAHDAHLGGAIFGIVFIVLMKVEVLGRFWNQLINVIAG